MCYHRVCSEVLVGRGDVPLKVLDLGRPAFMTDGVSSGSCVGDVLCW